MTDIGTEEAPSHPDLSPEARRRHARRRDALQEKIEEQLGGNVKVLAGRVLTVLKRVWTGAYFDGFIHAGNFAYMAILALFPFFIVVAAIFSAVASPWMNSFTTDLPARMLGKPMKGTLTNNRPSQ